MTYFSDTYDTARKRFLMAAAAAGAKLESHAHPLPGPRGERLSMDIARIGPMAARKVLLTFSATHGVEGFCGSAVQSGWFESGQAAELPEGVALIAVHGVNPYGFAWLRRVNEDNIDLNRNFVDFDAGLPGNDGYGRYHDLFCPPDWSDAIAQENLAACETLKQEIGERAYRSAHSGGQYSHADGIFFGGSAPSWSRRVIEEALMPSLRDVATLAVIDFHTGLGPTGYGERISMHAPGSRGAGLLNAWYGTDFTSTKTGTAVTVELSGTLLDCLERGLPATAVGAVALEFGTVDNKHVQLAVRADNWLHKQARDEGGVLDHPQGFAIKRDLRAAFDPQEETWRDAVWARSCETLGKALSGL